MLDVSGSASLIFLGRQMCWVFRNSGLCTLLAGLDGRNHPGCVAQKRAESERPGVGELGRAFF